MKQLLILGILLACGGAYAYENEDSYEEMYDGLVKAVTMIQENATLRAAWAEHMDNYERMAKKQKHGMKDFPCSLIKSEQTPTSVHALTPGDIKAVGAIGDSLSAGTLIDSVTVLGLLISYRGLTWNMGGNGDLDSLISLPNVLRKYNADLQGASKGTGPWYFKNAGFNMAVPGAKAQNMPVQAERLVNKLKKAKNIDFQNDWKIITIFIGGNDMCAYCNNEEKFSPENYVANVKKALDHIYAEVPRAFINVVTILNVGLLEHGDKGLICDLLHIIECPCGAYPGSDDKRNQMRRATLAYQTQLDDLVTSGAYDGREDFTVVVQPFFTETTLPRHADGKADMSYFSPDCFHLSKKGQEAAAVGLWNNMVEPVGNKKRSWVIGEPLECPTRARPFFSTYKNSGPGPATTTAKQGPPANFFADAQPEIHVAPEAGQHDVNNQGSGISAGLGLFIGLLVVVPMLAVIALVVRRYRKRKSFYDSLDEE